MKKISLGIAFTIALSVARAHADVPAGYTGTPFQGTPWPVPGRIDFEDFDEGGQGVGWSVDDHTGNFGEGGCAANDYREGIHPQLCKTNTNIGENDLYSSGPLMGQKYPSEAMPQSIYIGYTHAVDWVKLTVNVREAGTYALSSTWASEAGGDDAIKVQVSFNDVLKADVTLPGTGGYHNWADYADFATVELEAGLQVVQFAAKSMHLNYDYLQLSLLLPGGGVDDGSAGAGVSGGSGGSGGSAGAGGSASGGAAGAAGNGGGGVEAPLPSAGSGGAEPAPGAAGTSSAGVPSTTGAAAAPAAEPGGCACRLGAGRSSGSRPGALALALAFLAGFALLRRARRQRFCGYSCERRS